jgi:protein-disulfide isomerase/Skp family chaperone for outer membrane proteins
VRSRYLIAVVILVLAASAAAQGTSKTLATVNGEIITEAQVTGAAAADLATLESRRASSPATYERDKLVIMHKALDSIIEDKLVAAEAARDKVTKEQVLFAEVESNVSTPSPEEVEEFYQANKSRIATPHDQALPLVKQYMMDQDRSHYRDMMVYMLKKQFPVKIFLDPLRADVATAGHPSLGSDSSPVTIVEFADFQCPFCGGLFPTLKAVEKNYAGKVRFVFRQFPLTSIHPYAQKAAEASLCANDQKSFWEFHDSMYSNQERLSVDDLKKRASDLKLNTSVFNACLDSGEKVNAVKKDLEEGQMAGVTGTPAMFINGRYLSGNQPYADIRDVIEDELQRQAQSKEGGK